MTLTEMGTEVLNTMMHLKEQALVAIDIASALAPPRGGKQPIDDLHLHASSSFLGFALDTAVQCDLAVHNLASVKLVSLRMVELVQDGAPQEAVRLLDPESQDPCGACRLKRDGCDDAALGELKCDVVVQACLKIWEGCATDAGGVADFCSALATADLSDPVLKNMLGAAAVVLRHDTAESEPLRVAVDDLPKAEDSAHVAPLLMNSNFQQALLVAKTTVKNQVAERAWASELQKIDSDFMVFVSKNPLDKSSDAMVTVTFHARTLARLVARYNIVTQKAAPLNVQETRAPQKREPTHTKDNMDKDINKKGEASPDGRDDGLQQDGRASGEVV